MDTIYNSTGYYQDNLGPLAGLAPACHSAYVYPSHFPGFDWWREDDREPVKAILRDEVPIPILYNPYPYRYSSAKLSSADRTQKEWEIYKCERQLNPIPAISDKLDLKSVRQVAGYETTTMTATLAPFLAKVADNVFSPSPVPKGLNEPSLIPFKVKGINEFDKYVINNLHPNWKRNPLYRKRILFEMRPDELNSFNG